MISSISKSARRTLRYLQTLTTAATPKRPLLRTATMTNSSPLPDYEAPQFHKTRTVDPKWVPGAGANNNEWKKHKKVSVDPYAEGRPAGFNYKLLISGVTPRPVGFASTLSKDGVPNLAPFSYFNMMNHDPPIFALGCSRGTGVKDTAANIIETGEVTINIISEWFLDIVLTGVSRSDIQIWANGRAADITSMKAPSDINEWKLAGLTPLPSVKVKPPHVAESAFSVECKLVNKMDWTSPSSGNLTGTLLVLEGVNFHVREDIANSDFSDLDFAKFRPVARLGGISYGMVATGVDLPRLDYAAEADRPDVRKALEDDEARL